MGYYVAFFAVMLGAQLVLCFKTKHIAIKLIPLYLVAVIVAYAILCYAGTFGTSSIGALYANELAGLIIFFFACAGLLGTVTSWAIFGILCLVKRDNKQNNNLE